MRAVLLALCLAALSGCIGRSNVFYVDARFTLEERAAIQAAADSWEQVGAEPIDLIWGATVDVSSTGARFIVRTTAREASMAGSCVREDVDGNVGGLTSKRPNGETIYLMVDDHIRTEAAIGAFQGFIAHEFGHHYGLHHTVHTEALMFWQQKTNIPTPVDVAALRAL